MPLPYNKKLSSVVRLLFSREACERGWVVVPLVSGASRPRFVVFTAACGRERVLLL
jgi:hypothetical protein